MKVSIIIPTYNYGKFLERAIKSVLFQDYPILNRELIIVDGGSTDNTQEILNKFRNIENFVILNQKGKGLSNAVNYGILNSNGEYISRIDADDIFYQGILSKEIKILDNNSKVGFVYTDYNTFLYNENKKIRKYLPVFSKNEIIERGDFLSGGTMFRKSLFEKYGYYDEEIPTLDGYEMILRLMKNDVVGFHINEPLFEYTIHGDSMYDNVELIEKTGSDIAKKYGLSYIKNRYHPRNIYSD